jgi:carbamoyltransferase
MIVAGVNLPATRHGKTLSNGGAAIAVDGHVRVAVAEERIARVKHAAGFRSSLAACLKSLNVTLDEVDLVMASSCCEPVPKASDVGTALGVASSRVACISHHFSHGYGAYAASNFPEALVVVWDGGGNTLVDAADDTAAWWRVPREQATYYIGRDRELTVIARDFAAPHATGLGELYRYLTHHLGWRSADAGRAMSSAALGDPSRFGDRPVVEYLSQPDALTVPFGNEPLDPDVFDRFLASVGVRVPKLIPGQPLTQDHFDLAAWIQTQLTAAVVARLRSLTQSTGLRRVCLAGGVAYNCAMNEAIAVGAGIDELYVLPPAGDQGQAFGNATYAAVVVGDHANEGFEVYQGPTHNWDAEVARISMTDGTYRWRRTDEADLTVQAAEMIAKGDVVGWVQGRSELGPRALGNRSLLASASRRSSKDRLNRMKGREWFVPVAPSVMEERATVLFGRSVVSPYMLRAPLLDSSARLRYPVIAHVDGSARVQTVTSQQNPLFHRLLSTCESLLGEPVIANTSFNRRGGPIVESAADAARDARELGIDAVFVGPWVGLRRHPKPGG